MGNVIGLNYLHPPDFLTPLQLAGALNYGQLEVRVNVADGTGGECRRHHEKVKQRGGGRHRDSYP